MPRPRARQTLTRRPTRAVISIILAGFTLAVGYSFAIRLRWGPDEPGHIAYIESLALDGRFPTLGEQDVYLPGAAISHQVQHPPLYHLLAAGIYRMASPLSEDTRIRALRLFSGVLGVATLWLLWLLSGLIFETDYRARLVAVAGLAFLPMFSYVSGVVNNDALVVPLCVAAFYATVTVAATNDGFWRYAAAGALAGMAALTKEVALALLPVMIIAFLLPRGQGGPGLRRRLAGAVVALIPALAIPAMWWIRNLSLFGQPIVYAYVKPPFRNVGEIFADPYLALYIAWGWGKLTFRTLWAPYWAIRGIVPRVPYVAVSATVLVAGVAGLVRLWVDNLRNRRPLARVPAQALGLMLMFAALAAVGILRYTLLVDYRTMEGGRYMLIAWPCLTILGTAGWAHGANRLRAAVLWLLVLIWVVGDLTVLWAVGRTYQVW